MVLDVYTYGVLVLCMVYAGSVLWQRKAMDMYDAVSTCCKGCHGCTYERGKRVLETFKYMSNGI